MFLVCGFGRLMQTLGGIMSSYNESKEYLENGLCPECKTKLELMPSSGGRPYYTPELYCDYCCITISAGQKDAYSNNW